MKATVVSSLLLATYANGAVIQERQAGGLSGLMSMFAPPVSKPAKIEAITPRIRSTATRQYIRYGPIALPASKDGGASAGMAHGHGGEAGGMASSAPKMSAGISMDPNGYPYTTKIDGGYCTDCTVLGAKVDIIFENGTRADIANGVYLHHLVAMTTGKSQPSWVTMCPGNSTGGGILNGLLSKADVGGGGFVGGAVDEFVDYFTTPDGKVDSGYYMPAGASMIMSGEMINYLRAPQNVYIRLDIEWVPGRQGTDAIKTPLNVEGCDFTHSAFKKAAGKGALSSEDYTVTKDGTVVCQRAHMHDGGVGVTAYVNNKMVCNSEATYGLAGGVTIVDGKEWKTISRMSECTEPISLKKGDKIRLVAEYDNVKHPLRTSQGMEQGNMGFMTMTFVPAPAQ